MTELIHLGSQVMKDRNKGNGLLSSRKYNGQIKLQNVRLRRLKLRPSQEGENRGRGREGKGQSRGRGRGGQSRG